MGAALGFVLWGPWSALEQSLRGALLRANERSEAPEGVIIIRVAPSVEALASCPADLQRMRDRGGARGALWLGPAHQLCRSSDGAEPGALWSPECVRRDAGGPLGLRCGGRTVRALQRLGAERSPWFVPQVAGAIPSVALEDLLVGRVPARTLRGRVMVVEVSERASEGALEAAAVLASATPEHARRTAPAWLGALFAVLFAGAVSWSRRTAFGRTLPIAFACAAVTLAASFASARWGLAGLLPMGHLLVSIGIACVISYAPQLIATRRALRHAADLIERAALLRSDGIHTIAEAEFWSRIGDLAAQAHPADSVLVAELPPAKWHLKFWPYRGMGENVIRERRRDIRRRPYANDAGSPEINVTRNFLAMEGTPVVVVPLMAFGEVEGYVFLCGDKAERAYLKAPHIAGRLSQDFGLMLRRRRVASVKEHAWKRPGGLASSGPGLDTLSLVEGAEIALGDLKMFGSLVRNASVGLLYADAFGHVRILDSAFGEWLPRIGVSVPSVAEDAPLSPGALMLGSVLDALSDDEGPPLTLADVTARPEGLQFQLPEPETEERPARRVTLTVRALQESSDGVSWIAGYVATLVHSEVADDQAGAEVVRLPVERLSEVLGVRPLAESVRNVVRSAAARSGRAVQFEPPREMAHAIAYHRELNDAFEDLLFDAAVRDSSGKGPVVTLSEEGERVVVSILDVQFGVPPSALKRALLAPSDPPEGLEAFGRFAFAVAESHGTVELREDEWGITVVAKLMRARPLTRKPSLRPPGARRVRQEK